jgi:hypothetical protein
MEKFVRGRFIVCFRSTVEELIRGCFDYTNMRRASLSLETGVQLDEIRNRQLFGAPAQTRYIVEQFLGVETGEVVAEGLAFLAEAD